MADDAAPATSSAATTTTTASGPTQVYANNPSDPTTWSPAYAAAMAQNASLYAAKQAAAVSAPTLAELTPCAGLLDAAFTTLMQACGTLARTTSDAQLGSMLQSLSSLGQMASARFSGIYTPLADQAAAAAAAPAAVPTASA